MIRNKGLNSLAFLQEPADAYLVVRIDYGGFVVLGEGHKTKRATHFVLPLMLNIQDS